MRKTKRVWINQDNSRDVGKLFLITEKPAVQAELWAHRALGALAMADSDIPEEIRKGGIAGLAAVGFDKLVNINLDYYQMLMDEMMECVEIISDPLENPDKTRPLKPDDIEEVATLMALRSEVFSLHAGFSIAGVH